MKCVDGAVLVWQSRVSFVATGIFPEQDQIPKEWNRTRSWRKMSIFPEKHEIQNQNSDCKWKDSCSIHCVSIRGALAGQNGSRTLYRGI